MPSLRVIVCGGRDYADAERVCRALDGLARASPDGLFVMQGGATGADSHSRAWAAAHGQHCRTFTAEWEKLGRKAGPFRNRRMVHEGRPDLVLAFPGNRGTRDLINTAKAARVTVVELGCGR